MKERAKVYATPTDKDQFAIKIFMVELEQERKDYETMQLRLNEAKEILDRHKGGWALETALCNCLQMICDNKWEKGTNK